MTTEDNHTHNTSNSTTAIKNNRQKNHHQRGALIKSSSSYHSTSVSVLCDIMPVTFPPAYEYENIHHDTITILFDSGFLKDEWSQLVEPIQRGLNGRSFLWTGRKPEVGMRTETQVTTANGEWCRLSGVVTEVGDMPSLDEWRAGNSCQLPPSVKSNTVPIDQQLSLRDDFIEHFGTVHGQMICSYSILNFDFYDKQEDLPFKRDKLYKLTYKADENMSYFWCVTKIEDVTTLPDDEVPEVFRKWQGESKALSSCNRVSF